MSGILKRKEEETESGEGMNKRKESPSPPKKNGIKEDNCEIRTHKRKKIVPRKKENGYIIAVRILHHTMSQTPSATETRTQSYELKHTNTYAYTSARLYRHIVP